MKDPPKTTVLDMMVGPRRKKASAKVTSYFLVELLE
jgi:hypothetical protein